MKNKIGRILFWHQNEQGLVYEFTKEYFGLAMLLNRLLNEVYTGKAIKFANVYFNTKQVYDKYPVLTENYVHYFGGHLKYYGLIDISTFEKLTQPERNIFIWNTACEYLRQAAIVMKNNSLLEAVDQARLKGLVTGPDIDFRLLEEDAIMCGHAVKVSVWINFTDEEMLANFTVEQHGEVVFKRFIDRAKIDVEYFLDIYKNIDVKDNRVIINGRKEISYLPLTIEIDKDVFCPNK